MYAAYCHCTRCQRRSGTAAAPSARVAPSAPNAVAESRVSIRTTPSSRVSASVRSSKIPASDPRSGSLWPMPCRGSLFPMTDCRATPKGPLIALSGRP